MTCREKLKSEHPDWDDERVTTEIRSHGCPHYYKYLDMPSWCTCGASDRDCDKCWDREIPAEVHAVDTTVEPIIKDSGDRTQFSSGAVRDMHTGKGDMVSLPASAILRLSKHYENGALKYGRWNYQKGIPISSFLDSALRHLFKYLDGWDDEDHLAAAAFNVLGAMEMEANHKEMIDLPTRKEKNRFEYDQK